jgi:hypothetical protein
VGTLIRSLLLCIATWAAAGPLPARASPYQPIDKSHDLCGGETARQERRLAIPRHLLTAISMAESGRWDKASRANVAWPWTVTAEGQGRFFDSKGEAMAEVEILMTRGVRNIDVGCMQVNLFYHGSAFETLAEAFDPAANTAYAATYLKSMFQATGNWSEAAGFYHSTTPERNGPYREKVIGFWRQMSGYGNALASRPEEPAAEGRVYMDYARMARLNTAMKERREAARPLLSLRAPAAGIGETREKQLQEWRDTAGRGGDTMHLLAVRQAEHELKRKRQLNQLEKNDGDVAFSQRRLKQMRDWRMRVAGTGMLVAGAPAEAESTTPATAAEPVSRSFPASFTRR